MGHYVTTVQVVDESTIGVLCAVGVPSYMKDIIKLERQKKSITRMLP